MKGAIGPLPARVSIHRVVAAANRGDLRDGELREVPLGRGRRDVPAVGERVEPGPRGHVLAFGEVQEGPHVVDVRVNPAVGDKSEQVNVRVALPGPRRKAEMRASFSKNDPSSIALLTRTRSCKRMRPEPIVRCPTSEFPICPAGNPTAAPEASRVVCGYRARSPSNTGVSASSTAFPGPGGASPQPSRITSTQRGNVTPAPGTRRDRSPRSSSSRAMRLRRALRPHPAGRGATRRCRA